MREFEDELRHALGSKHPAVSEKAKWALSSLGFEVDISAEQRCEVGRAPA
jgi:uroporphyrinogen-III synthase